MKFKILRPANAVSHFENCHFLSHRPPDFLQGAMHFQNLSGKNRSSILSEYKMRAPEKNGPLQTLFPSMKIAIF